MTAEDVKYSLERSAKESAMNRLSGVTEVKVLSDYEVEIHLATPNLSLLAMLTDAGNIIIPKKKLKDGAIIFLNTLLVQVHSN